MGIYLKNIPCINPKHEDTNPSMAVYQEDGGKLMVHCFGCKFSGIVTPDQVQAAEESAPAPVVKQDTSGFYQITEGVPEPVHTKVLSFFRDRNFKVIPDACTVLLEKDENNPDHYRPAFRYTLFDYNGVDVVGSQTRYVDDLSPKVRLHGASGKHPPYCWVTDHVTDNPYGNIGITESMVDAWFILEYVNPTYPILVLLGTNVPKDLAPLVAELGLVGDYHTFFDRDKAGEAAHIDVHRKLRHVSKGGVVDHLEGCPRPTKVYEMFTWEDDKPVGVD